MNIFLYIIIFIMGTVFGSFYTLAVYRLPRKIDIVKTHSFCPNCNHKLGFWEMIPVWSYLLLGGKCKKCKQKIRPRYFILEILSGIAFVIIALGLKINIETVTNIYLLIDSLFIALYLVFIFIIAGIDKERTTIQKNVLYYGLVISLLYIIYLCIIDKFNMYRYIIYLTVLLILLIIDIANLQKRAKNNYTLQILMLLTIMLIFTGEYVSIFTVIATLLLISIIIISFKIKNGLNKTKKETKVVSENLHIGFYLCILNVIVFAITLFLVI